MSKTLGYHEFLLPILWIMRSVGAGSYDETHENEL
jgi:hypothetical protein